MNATDLADAILHAYNLGKEEGYAEGYAAACDGMEESEGVDVEDPDMTDAETRYGQGFDDGAETIEPHPEDLADGHYAMGYSDGREAFRMRSAGYKHGYNRKGIDLDSMSNPYYMEGYDKGREEYLAENP